jgi:hypothetical protein
MTSAMREPLECLLDVEAVGFVVLEEDVDLVDAAEEVVQVAHDVLVGAGEVDAEVIGLVVLERVERDVVLHVLQVDEASRPCRRSRR